MQLASILDQYHDAFQAQYASRLSPAHLRTIEAIRCCRTPEAGHLLVQCNGLRSCNRATPLLWAPQLPTMPES